MTVGASWPSFSAVKMATGSLVDLWEWDGARWRQLDFIEPQARLDIGH
jgi:hypothetical protein